MSVQIKFHIIKFSPDATSVLTLQTKALDILHGNLLGFRRDFRKVMALIFSSMSIYLCTPKLQQLQIMKSRECTAWGLYGGWWTNVKTNFLVAFRFFKHVCSLALS
jgi:hypothetical protein